MESAQLTFSSGFHIDPVLKMKPQHAVESTACLAVCGGNRGRADTWNSLQSSEHWRASRRRCLKPCRGNRTTPACSKSSGRSGDCRNGNSNCSDLLRVEVALVDGKEMFAWPGARKFEQTDLTEMVTAGAIGTGDFALHARAVFQTRAPRFKYAGASGTAFAPNQSLRFRGLAPQQRLPDPERRPRSDCRVSRTAFGRTSNRTSWCAWK